MNCPSCGATLPRRATARVFITGALLIAAGFVLLFIIHLAVVVLASVVLVAFGATMLRGARKAQSVRCPHCHAQIKH